MGIMPIITILLSCQNIRTNEGFVYSAPNGSSARLHWERSWYTTDGECLSDGTTPNNGKRHPLVVKVNRENITLSECIDLEHRQSLDLPESKQREKVVHLFKVSADNTSVAVPSAVPSAVPIAVPIAVLVALPIAALGIGIFCCLKRKKKKVVHADENGTAVIPMLNIGEAQRPED